MKKIKSIQQLQAEKRRLRQEQEAIEKCIRENWHEVKDGLRPANIAREALGGMFRKRTSTDERTGGLWKTAVEVGLTILAGKLGENALEKLMTIFQKGKTGNKHDN